MHQAELLKGNTETLLMTFALAAFLLSPTMLELQIAYHHAPPNLYQPDGEEVTHWFTNPT